MHAALHRALLPDPGRAASACVRPLLAAGLALVALVTPARAQLTLDVVMRDTVLANGLHVIVVPNPTIPLATIQVTVRNGAFTQLTEEELGVPHLLEHMLFRAFGADGFGADANRIDASYNGTTGDETVTYYITLPSANLGRGIQLMADLMRSPRFNREMLQPEQHVVRGELERSVADPTYLLSSSVDQRLWGDGWGRKNAIGNVISILGATPARLQQLYQRFYVPNNAAVVITGDVTAADAFALSARHFARWQRAADPFETLELPPMPALRTHQLVTASLDANDVTMLIRWQGPRVREEPVSTHAADLLAALVNDRISGMQGRLVDSGLFQSVSMGHETRAHVGPVTIYATTTADMLVEASAALRAELTMMGQPGYFTSEDLDIARKRREVDWALYMEQPSGLAWFVGEMWSVAGGLDYLRGYLPAIEAVDAAQLEAFVATYLADRPRVTGILLSPATRQELGSRLVEAFDPWRQ